MSTDSIAAQSDALVRLTKACRQLDVSYWALRDWCREGKVRHHRIGKKLLMIPQSEIDRILRDSLVIHPPAA
jgi:predicted site-specific integrase-resolvase